MRIYSIEFYPYKASFSYSSSSILRWFCRWTTSHGPFVSEICSKQTLILLIHFSPQIQKIHWTWASILLEDDSQIFPPAVEHVLQLVVFHLLKKKSHPQSCALVAINALAPKFLPDHVCVKWKWHQNWQQTQLSWIRVDVNRNFCLEQFLNHSWDWTRIEYVEEPVNQRYALEQLSSYPIALDESLTDWYRATRISDLPKAHYIIKAYSINGLPRMIDLVNHSFVTHHISTFTSNFETHVGVDHQMHMVYWMDLKTPMGFDTLRWIEQIESEIKICNGLVCDTRVLFSHNTT